MFLNIITKSYWRVQRVSTSWPSCHSSGAHKGPCSGPSPTSAAVLGVARRSFSSGVARAYGGGLVGLRWRFFPSSLFSISFPRKTCLNFKKKNNCILRFVILSILVLFHLITVYLVFDTLLSLIFFIFIPGYFIQFFIKLFFLEHYRFFTFLIAWLFRERVVKLTQIGSWFFDIFLIELWFLLRGHPLEILFFFILISYRGFLIHQVTQSWLGFSSSMFYFLKFFFFNIRY